VSVNPARRRAEEFLQLCLDGFMADREEFVRAVMELQHNAVEQILRNFDVRPCARCGQAIAWVTHANGKKAPYTQWGHNHFVDCPRADEFRSKEKET